MNWLVDQELAPKIASKWKDIARSWKLAHSIGIDRGDAVITRGGVSGDNDLISVGSAPNIGAKLSEIRNGYSLHITDAVYEPMAMEVAFFENQPIWHREGSITVGHRTVNSMGSNAYWAF